MSQQWYCRIADTEYGPISSTDMRRWVQECRLSPDDYVRQEEGAWIKARDLKGLQWPSAQPVAPVSPSPPEEMAEIPWEAPASSVTLKLQHKAGDRLARSPSSWLALFDWRFEYYLTPWIIRALWLCFLVLAVVGFCFTTIGLVWGLLPEMSTTSAPPDFGGGGYTRPSDPLLPRWLTTRVAQVIAYVVSVIGSIIGILVTRMMLELMIVVFRIAEDIGFLKRKASEEGKG